jgi:hypothetical protein
MRALEAEVVRRERMIRDLVGSLEEQALERARPAGAHPTGAVGSEEPSALTDELARENSILRWRLDALAMELARRDAEAQGGQWTIQELEHELAREAGLRAEEPAQAPPAGASPAPAGDAERRLTEALAEVDALRLALTQEHAARVGAESGEELVRAREELQRQAVLLEQLARELEATRAPREELR